MIPKRKRRPVRLATNNRVLYAILVIVGYLAVGLVPVHFQLSFIKALQVVLSP